MDRLLSLRVGAAERDRAVDALTEHMVAERLTMDEFRARMESAQTASSESDLRALFDDLPAPRWDGDGSSVPVAPTGRQRPLGDSTAGGRQDAGRAGRAASTVANALYPASGAIAVALSASTGAWEWLLVVPPVFYGIRQTTRRLWPSRPGTRGPRLR